jgi:hypothetical protein
MPAISSSAAAIARGITAGRAATAIGRTEDRGSPVVQGPVKAAAKAETSGRRSSRGTAAAGANVRDEPLSLSSVTIPLSVLECPPLTVEGACVFLRPSSSWLA